MYEQEHLENVVHIKWSTWKLKDRNNEAPCPYSWAASKEITIIKKDKLLNSQVYFRRLVIAFMIEVKINMCPFKLSSLMTVCLFSFAIYL